MDILFVSFTLQKIVGIHSLLDMNRPLLTGIAFILVIFFLRARTPEGSVREKLSRMDISWPSAHSCLLIYLYNGNLIVVVGTILAIIGLAWGGVRFPWNSVKVLAPFIIDMCLVGFFIYYEAKFLQFRSISCPTARVLASRRLHYRINILCLLLYSKDICLQCSTPSPVSPYSVRPLHAA